MARGGLLPSPDEIMEGRDTGPTPVAPGHVDRQAQTDHDYLNGPGWTVDDQKTGFFDNSLGAVPRGIGQASADIYGLLAHGLSKAFEPVDAPVVVGDGTVLPSATKPEDHPWHPAADALEQQAADAREYSKSLMPNPRVTGQGANIIQGLTKTVGEFTAGTAVGGPAAGAALLGTAEGRSTYLDLLDQGIDPATARKSALLTGTLSAGAAFLPMSLPAKAVAGLSTPAALAVQAGVGASVNTAFGVGQRYASAKILSDAGYKAQAEQIKPWDELNLAVDFLSGAAFGAHSGWHGIKGVEGEQAAADAARVVQDRQAALDRAPGVPVDSRSMAAHNELLEAAKADLLGNEPVNVEDRLREGALFARPEEDTAEARAIIRDAFLESGIMKDAEDFDRWARGETEPVSKPETTKPSEDFNDEIPPVSEKPVIEPEPEASPRAKPDAAEPSARAVKPVHEMTSEELHAEADRQDAADVATLKRVFPEGNDAEVFNKLASSDSDSAYARSERMMDKLTPAQRDIVEKWETEAGNGRDLRDLAKEMEHIAGSETPEELGNLLGRDLTQVGQKKNPAEMKPKELTAYMRLKQGMETAQEHGWDTAAVSEQALKHAAGRFSDPADAEFMLARFLRYAEKPAGEGTEAHSNPAAPALTQRPLMSVVDENGDKHPALLSYDSAAAQEAAADKEAEPMHRAAVECEARYA